LVKNVLIAVSLAMSAGMYWPLFNRILKRKHTRDYSKIFQWLVMLVQINNGILAVAEKAWYLVGWYILQTVLTLVQLYLVHKYWNTLPPLMRSERNHTSSKVFEEGFGVRN
jgi:hypothetical protein